MKSLPSFLFGFIRLFYFDRVAKQKEFILIVLGFIAYQLFIKFLSQNIYTDNLILVIILGLGFVASLWIYIAGLSARLRDINKNQFFLLVTFIPFINLIFILFLFVTPSVKINNKK